MRIGIFSDTYTPDINGVVTSIVTLKDALQRQGHTVFIITNQPSILSTTYEDGVLRLPGLELKFLYGYVLSSPIHIQALSVVEEMDLNVIHVHSEFGIGTFARLAVKNLHLPLVSTYHTTYEDYTHYVNLLGLKSIDHLSKRAVAKMSRMFTKQAQVIIAPSEKTKKMLLGYDIKKRIEVVPTGLDLSRFANRNEARLTEIRATYNVGEKPLFVYIGRLAKEKSIDVVLDAFKILLDKGVEAEILIVGGGPSDKELHEQAEHLGIIDSVRFVGPVAATDVVNFYHVSDAFISASLTETQGLTYIEALACGLCVFARPDKPLEGIIIDDETGYLFDSSESFAIKAKGFIEASLEERARLKENALRRSDAFDSVHFATSVVNVYQQAIDGFFGRYVVSDIVHENGEVYLSLEQDEHEERLIIDEYVLERREIEVGKEMSRNELNEIEDDQAIFEAYQMALARIGIKDYTAFEMSEYLRSKIELTQEQVDIVIDLLKKRHFIDDDRYLRDKIYYHREQMRGNERILQDLRKRGYEADRIIQALDDEDYDDYTERGVQRAESYLNTLKDGSTRQRELKLKQHLTRQGFASDVISDIVGRIMNDDYTEENEYDSLKNVMTKSWARYERKYDARETKNRVVKHALSRGYNYDMIVHVLEELEHDEN